MRERFGVGGQVEQLAPCVLVGVDDIPSRWIVQRYAKGDVLLVGTSHFSISSSSHVPGEPCSGCQHPVDEVGGAATIPTVSFVSFWAGLAMARSTDSPRDGGWYIPETVSIFGMTPLRMRFGLARRYGLLWRRASTAQ